jgi:hypothetical protein
MNHIRDLLVTDPTNKSVRNQWPRGLKRRTAACRLRVRIQPGALMPVSRECWVLWGRGICDGSIPHAEESTQCVFVCVCVRARARVCVCVSVSVIRSNSKPLHLYWVGRRGQTKKNSQYVYNSITQCVTVLLYWQCVSKEVRRSIILSESQWLNKIIYDLVSKSVSY